MTKQTPKLDVPTLEYILSVLETETEAYREGSYKAGAPLIHDRRHAIFSYLLSRKSELKTFIEEQREVA